MPPHTSRKPRPTARLDADRAAAALIDAERAIGGPLVYLASPVGNVRGGISGGQIGRAVACRRWPALASLVLAPEFVRAEVVLGNERITILCPLAAQKKW